jgi:hypothetical protein
VLKVQLDFVLTGVFRTDRVETTQPNPVARRTCKEPPMNRCRYSNLDQAGRVSECNDRTHTRNFS